MVNYRTLYGVCLASRAWLEVGRRQLYHTIQLPDAHFRRFIQCIVQTPYLGRCVRQLRLDSYAISYEPSPMGLFPDLTTVWYERAIGKTFKIQTLSWFAKLMSQRLIQLSANVTHFVSEGLQSWVDISQGWPLLKTSEFRGTSHPFHQLPAQPIPLFPSLDTVIWRSGLILSMTSIPPVQPHSLHTVILDGMHGAEPGVFEFLFKQQGNTLQRLEVCGLWDSPLILIPYCTRHHGCGI